MRTRRDNQRIGRSNTLLSLAILAAASLAWLAGCGGADVELAPVEGIVTLDGQPVGGAGVLFTPEKAGTGPSASGTTDARGEFRLATANRPGAPLGNHLVLISKTQRPEPPRLPDGRVDERKLLQMPEMKVEYLVPARYSNRAAPQLRATVEADVNNRFTFSLTSGETGTEAAAEPAESE